MRSLLFSRTGASLPPWAPKLELLSVTQFLEIVRNPEQAAGLAKEDQIIRNAAGVHDFAAKLLAELAKGQDTYAANLAEHAKKYSETELNILRKNEPIPLELLRKIKGHILDLARALFEVQPYFKLPAVKDLPNTFLFRYAISGYVVALRRIKEGGASGASAEKIRNDLIDAMIAAYATYFDGLSSGDQKAKEIRETTCDLLKHFHEEIRASNDRRTDDTIAQKEEGEVALLKQPGLIGRQR